MFSRVALSLRLLPIAVRLDGLHFFGGRAGVLAWAVDGGGALRELQAQIWSVLDGAGRHPQHEPGRWTPHISLARRLRPGQEALAAQAVGEVLTGGTLTWARSYDTITRTATPLLGRPDPAPPGNRAGRGR